MSELTPCPNRTGRSCRLFPAGWNVSNAGCAICRSDWRGGPPTRAEEVSILPVLTDTQPAPAAQENLGDRLVDPCVHRGTIALNRETVCCGAMYEYACALGIVGQATAAAGRVTVADCAGCGRYE